MSRLTQTGNDFIQKVRDAGVVGEGGAGFPAHVKFDTQADTLIANGCECEPLLYSDQHLMQQHSKDIVKAMQEAMSILGCSRGIIAIKKKYTDIAAEFRKAIGSTGIELAELDNFYPAGDEQILIHELTGKTIQPLGLPKDVGIVVTNVGSLVSVSNALSNIPVTSKLVTVTGEISNPSIVEVPIGTSIQECIDNCGGVTVTDPVVILGGPMMGRFVDNASDLATEVITKTTGGIIVIPRGHFLHEAATLSVAVMQKRASTTCIQCGMCTEICPRYLVGQGFETHRVMRAFAGGVDQGPHALQAVMCCECGVCELFACPMGLSPRRINVMLKNRFREEKIQYQGPRDIKPHQSDFRSFRKVPIPRLAMRTDISKYMELHPEFKGSYLPSRVQIPLQQHIGAPSQPVVKPGDKVQIGDCIADIPEGALGARIHASISGIVQSVDSSITIEGTQHA
jgi:Na+-translocating ferredoxin:NAD+ oxidoreductase RnfC subunit